MADLFINPDVDMTFFMYVPVLDHSHSCGESSGVR